MSSPKPFFSVIIPTYNRGEMTLRAANSVLAQSDADFELLVVDDASTDNSLELLSTLQDPRVRVIALEQNGGVSTARNAGVKEAVADYVVFLDSDDEFRHDTLALYRQQIERLPDIDLTWAAIERQSETSEGKITHREIYMVRANSYDPEQANRIFPAKLGGSCGFAMRRDSYLQLGGFDESLRVREDHEFFIRVLQTGLRYCSVNRPQVLMHLHKEESLARNLQPTDILKFANAHERIMQMHAKFLDLPENLELFLRLNQVLIKQFYRVGERRRARQRVFLTLRRQPWHWKTIKRMLRHEFFGNLLKKKKK